MADMSVRFLRAQLKKLTCAAEEEPISVERKAQDFLGTVMQKMKPGNMLMQESFFEGFRAVMISPMMPARAGAVMYVHGGGYCCGDLEYAKGFGTILASESIARVFCPPPKRLVRKNREGQNRARPDTASRIRLMAVIQWLSRARGP